MKKHSVRWAKRQWDRVERLAQLLVEKDTEIALVASAMERALAPYKHRLEVRPVDEFGEEHGEDTAEGSASLESPDLVRVQSQHDWCSTYTVVAVNIYIRGGLFMGVALDAPIALMSGVTFSANLTLKANSSLERRMLQRLFE